MFNGFERDNFYQTLIVKVENHCIKEFPCTKQDFDELNLKIATYCRQKGYCTYKQAYELLLRSQLVSRCNIPLEMLIKQTQKQSEEFEEIFKEIEASDNDR